MSNKLTKSSNKVGVGPKSIAGLDNILKAEQEALTKFELPRTFNQLVLFILDGSGSMTFEGITGKSKGQEIHQQIMPILDRLKTSKNKNCFDICMFSFSEDYMEFISVTPLVKIDHSKMDFDPCNYIENGGTYAEEVLKVAEKRIAEYLNKYKSMRTEALILFLTDGEISDIDQCTLVCDRIKKNKQVKIGAYFFEDQGSSEYMDDEDNEMIKSSLCALASGPEFFSSEMDAEKIRDHMIYSISVTSKLDI